MGGTGNIQTRAGGRVVRADADPAVFKDCETAARYTGSVNVECAICRLRITPCPGGRSELQKRGWFDSDADLAGRGYRNGVKTAAGRASVIIRSDLPADRIDTRRSRRDIRCEL